MASTLDFAVAVGLFFTFIAVLIVLLLNFLVNYTSLTSTSELRTVAYNFYLSLFLDRGIPRNWTESGNLPLKIGLVTDFYRVPVIVAENSSTNRGNVTLNLTIPFDANCENRAWNDTVRIVNASNLEIPSRLFNQTFCRQQFLQKADIVFSNSFNSGESKNFSIYFSLDKNITAPNYTLPFPTFVNFSFTIYPEEKLTVVSAEKLIGLRRLNESDVLNTLGKDYYFNIRISDE